MQSCSFNEKSFPPGRFYSPIVESFFIVLVHCSGSHFMCVSIYLESQITYSFQQRVCVFFHLFVKILPARLQACDDCNRRSIIESGRN